MPIPISQEPGYWTRPDARSLTLAQFTDIELSRMDAVPRIPIAGQYKPGRLLRYVLDHKDELQIPTGLWLEFGVWSGSSINTIAEHTRRAVFGFDSFQGLPEDWDRGFGQLEKASAFDRGGVMPEVADNVVLIKGWFDQTLPPFLQIAHEPIAFMHVDCDLYSSTKTIFDALGARLQAGTVIVFDELVSYTSWEQGEWKALYELCMQTGMQFDWIGKIGDIIRHFDEFISIKDVRERYGVDPEAALIVREPGRPST
jgi:hypothetical protein